MKNLLPFVILFLSFQFNAQTANYHETKALSLKNGEKIYTNTKLYTYENFVYVNNCKSWSPITGTITNMVGPFKIHKDSIQIIHEDTKEFKSDKVAYYLHKFAVESQIGIGLQVVGGALSIGLSFANVSPYIYLSVPPLISVTGFIIWATSYRHLKKFYFVSDAKNYFS
jgi:hypothetical protein